MSRRLGLVLFLAAAMGCGASRAPSTIAGACPEGRADCDGDPSNGCEADLLADQHACGACGSPCAPGLECVSGHCGGISDIAVGGSHACVLREGGTVACWGENGDGQLGDGTRRPHSNPVVVVDLEDAIAVAAGAAHTCALREAGTVVCWGRGDAGQLGHGELVEEGVPTPVEVSGLAGVVELRAGGDRTCARRVTGEVLCWGLLSLPEGPGREPEAVPRPTAIAMFTSTDDAAVEAEAEPGLSARPPVPVTLHVMSKCPYGVKAMDVWTEVARKVGPPVKLEVEYIGREFDGELTSMHGDDEVAGDIVELCVEHHAPYGAWLDFLDCFNEEWRQIPDRWEECARRVHVDVQTVRACSGGAEGQELLRASFQVSVDAEASGSPTMFIGGTKHTGGRTVLALSRAVCAEIEQGRSRYCDHLPPPAPVAVAVLEDRRCTRPECDLEPTLSRLKVEVPGARFTRLDYGTREGRALFDQLGLKLLPAVAVDRSVRDDAEAFRALSGYKRVDDYFVETFGRFDPRVGLWLERPVVPVTLFSDARCHTRECEAADRFEDFVARRIEHAKIERVDYSTAEGRQLWKKLSKAWSPGRRTYGEYEAIGLPLAVFGPALEQEEEFYSRLQRRLRRVADDYVFQLGPWDPTVEICDNHVDDDGDRRVDCRDPDCREKLPCRPEKQRHVDLFIMSGCPYAIQVLNALGEVLDNFERDRRQFDLQLHYIGEVSDEGELSSMHGEWEVDEDLRQICAQRHYGKAYLFMDYVRCRAQSVRSSDWEQCVSAPMKVEVIRRCAEGEEGRRLLRESFELAKALAMDGSPSWLLNNRYEMEGRSPEDIRASFCERNDGPGCDRTLSTDRSGGAPTCGD